MLLRNPRREVEVGGPLRVERLLAELDIEPHTVLVIRNRELVPKDATLRDEDDVEIRPVVSGGST